MLNPSCFALDLCAAGQTACSSTASAGSPSAWAGWTSRRSTSLASRWVFEGIHHCAESLNNSISVQSIVSVASLRALLAVVIPFVRAHGRRLPGRAGATAACRGCCRRSSRSATIQPTPRRRESPSQQGSLLLRRRPRLHRPPLPIWRPSCRVRRWRPRRWRTSPRPRRPLR